MSIIPSKASDLIREARKTLGLNQTDFANKFNKTQGEISKYEKGATSPPAEMCMQCVHILLREYDTIHVPTVEMIVKKLKSGFDMPEYEQARRLILEIVTYELGKAAKMD